MPGSDLHRDGVTQKELEIASTDYTAIPNNLPARENDGASYYLQGQTMPNLILKTSDGGTVNLSALGAGRTVIWV
jgi:hypothetical protein